MNNTLKYSILMPYYDRHIQLMETLQSFQRYADRKDFEIVLVEDYKNVEGERLHTILIKILEIYAKNIPIQHFRYPENIYNPSTMYNLAAKAAKGEYLIITNPECRHEVDILKGLDEEFKKDSDQYVVCGCQSLNPEGVFIKWYQHSVARNCRFHFCTAISESQWKSFGGFDSAYKYGYCFDDDDLRETIIRAGIKITTRDDLLVSHQWHDKGYRPSNWKQLWLHNKAIYESKFGVHNSYG